MSIELDATVGGSDSNAYVLVDDVNTVAPFRPTVGTAWLAASGTPDMQAQAIVQATTRIDQLQFIGVPASGSQALQWPRSDVKDRYCRPVDSSALPKGLTAAVISLAMNYVSQISINADPLAVETQSIQIAKAGDAEVQYFASAPVANPTGWNDTSDLPADVVRALNQYLAVDPTAVTLGGYWGQSKAIRTS